MLRASFKHWFALYALAALFLIGALGLEYCHHFSIGRIPDVMCKTLHAVSYVIFFADMITLVWLSVIGMLTIATWSFGEFRVVAAEAKDARYESRKHKTSVRRGAPPEVEL